MRNRRPVWCYRLMRSGSSSRRLTGDGERRGQLEPDDPLLELVPELLGSFENRRRAKRHHGGGKTLLAETLARIRTLIADMLDTMYDAKGIGLAASQVDVHERLVVIDTSEERDEPMVLINPEITWYSPEKHIGEEGCLSVPEIYDKVERAVSVKVSYLDAKGQPQQLEAGDMLAVCIQHELDHLLGKVFVEYLSPLKRNRIKTKMIKAQREESR